MEKEEVSRGRKRVCSVSLRCPELGDRCAERWATRELTGICLTIAVFPEARHLGSNPHSADSAM